MTHSLVLLSQDESLPNNLNSVRPLLRVSDASELSRALNDGAASAIVDLRSIVSGGHQQADLLERLAELHPGLEWFLLAAEELPERLERTRIALQARTYDSLASLSDTLAAIPETDPTAADPSVETREVAAFQRDEAVLNGLSRSFETRTPTMRHMLSELEVAARHDVSVLLIGETGTGKTFLSKLTHEISPRAGEPFLHVACGALPSELIESELFGHVKGAFTSASSDKEGKFLAAGRGTILLDEIDVLGPDQQVKLLKVIETGEFEPVGSNKTYTSQARLIVASNLELQPLVEQGRFRPDLYYRLNMLKFELPPLRHRKPDLIPLAHKFIAQMAEKHQISIHRIDSSLTDALLAYPWPGNVRELENVIQRAVIYCRDGILTSRQLPSYIQMGIVGPANDASVRLGTSDNAQTRSMLGRQVAFTERDVIEQALSKNNFSRTRTAKSLGISRVTLYNKMKKYGMMN